MKRKWLAEGLEHDMDVEHSVSLVDSPVVIVAEEQRKFSEEQVAKLKMIMAKGEADKRRAELASADPETHAVERDQHNNPVEKPGGSRKQRRARASYIRRAVRAFNKAAKRRRKR